MMKCKISVNFIEYFYRDKEFYKKIKSRVGSKASVYEALS